MNEFSDEVYERIKMTDTDLPSSQSREFKFIVLGTLYTIGRFDLEEAAAALLDEVKNVAS